MGVIAVLPTQFVECRLTASSPLSSRGRRHHDKPRCHPQREEHDTGSGAFFPLVLGLPVSLLPSCQLWFGSGPQSHTHKGQWFARQGLGRGQPGAKAGAGRQQPPAPAEFKPAKPSPGHGEAQPLHCWALSKQAEQSQLIKLNLVYFSSSIHKLVSSDS